MGVLLKGGERSLKARAEDEQAVHKAKVRELRTKWRARTRVRSPKKQCVTDGWRVLQNPKQYLLLDVSLSHV